MPPDKVEEIIKDFNVKILTPQNKNWGIEPTQVNAIHKWLRTTLTRRDQDMMSEVVEGLKPTVREIEIIVQDTIGKAYQKRFNENLDYDQWVGIRDEMTTCSRHISNKIDSYIELNHQALTEAQTIIKSK